MSHTFTDRVFALVDKRDATAFAALFAPHGRFVFGNAEPICGPAAIAEAVQAFFDGIRGLRHTIVNRWEVAPATAAELSVEYHRLDGEYVTVPAVTIFDRGAGTGQITSYRIFVDLAPLFAVR
ncbi:nuclear transport factor 2 family protein [Cryptosporangium sp. NPDC051539]|uniref:nuclear transport factor 2 family protein n=1 Tax=Cryptosporangium sp. NPDC051539 TaxID=3363962 RepID=UPI0037913D09